MKQGSNFVVALVTVGGIVAACLLSACGSGGSGSSTNGTNVSQVAVTSTGTITDFGSVYINDRKYEINDSTTTMKDDSTVTGDNNAKSVLRRGMVVTVTGTSSGTTRTASTIVHQNTLEGPIQTKSQIDASNGTLLVLGQTVVVDATTKFDNTSTPAKLNSLSQNDVIEVSGFVKEDTTGVFIMASFIEKKTGVIGCNSICEVKGKITSHTPPNLFQIGTLIVNYTTADITDMPNPNAVSWVGLFVEVKGSNYDANNGTLTATKVEREGFQAPNGNQVELEGYVTSLIGGAGSGQFMIGTTTVQATNAVYLGGLSSEITVGQKLEVQGSISNSVITATMVKFQDAVGIESNVASKTGSSFTLDGMSGVTVVVNSQTAFKNVANLSAVAVGNNVRIRGREGAGNTVIATEVELKSTSADSKVVLQGVVQTVANPSLTVLGVTINTIGLQLRDINDNPINPTTFFSVLTPSRTVIKAKGQLIGLPTTSVWKELELESE